MSTPEEVFDTNYDYHYAAEQRRNPQKGLVQVMGERALRWFKGMNQKRKDEKAERNYNGSLAEISHQFQPAVDVTPQAPMQPHKMTEPGMYRSMHAIHSVEEQAAQNREGTFALDDEMAELMHGAVKRAREKMAADGQTQTTAMRAVDHETPVREATPQDDDQLVGAGK